MTTDLIAFITARLDEDEQWALAASAPYEYAAEGASVPPGGVHWTWVVGENWTPVTVDPAVDDKVGGPEHYGCDVNLASVEEWITSGSDHGWPVRTMPRTVALGMVEVDSSAAGHIARHDPARVLREVEAKRRILEHHSESTLPNGIHLGTCMTCDNWEMPCPTLRLLADPYSDHPDFRSEWAP